jgi:isoprenylcysteine carboxyl methyltransferase (ICMT) family protein YpbQ
MAFYFLNVITEKTMLHLFAKPEIDMLFKYAIYIIALYNIKDKNQRSFYPNGEDG